MHTSLNQTSEQIKRRAPHAVDLLKSLANEDRFVLFCQINNHRMNVGQLGEVTGIKQPTLSQQLSILRSKGLVEAQRQGKHVYYEVLNSNIASIVSSLCSACNTLSEQETEATDEKTIINW